METLPSLKESSREPPRSLRFRQTPTSRTNSKLPDLQRRDSIVSTYRNELYQPKIVTFMKNGDRFFQGVKVNVSSRNFRSWDVLLSELSRCIDLPAGVRHIYTPDAGHRVTGLNRFEHQKTYVCASTEPFKRISYNKAKTPTWNGGTKVRGHSKTDPPFDLSKSMQGTFNTRRQSQGTKASGNNPPFARSREAVNERRHRRSLQQLSVQFSSQISVQHHQQQRQEQLARHPPRKQIPSVLPSSEPTQLTVICNGPPPRKVVTVFLNRQSIASWEQAHSLISESLQCSNGCLRLYSVDGVEVDSLSQLWKTNNVLIAVGHEEFDMAEFLRGSRPADGGKGTISRRRRREGKRRDVRRGQTKVYGDLHYVCWTVEFAWWTAIDF